MIPQSTSFCSACCRTARPSRRIRERGFALVVTLSLMILLTILAVGLLTLSSVSLRSTSQGAAMATARANARLALMLALGELQKQAGPDQRVTARADILDNNNATAQADGVNQPDWSGVWKTGAAGLDVGGSPQRTTSLGSLTPTLAQKSSNAAWLVSNPNPATAVDPISWTGATAVTLAKLGNPSRDVRAPLVSIAKIPGGGTAQGNYAYWVSDEGVKAKVNIKDPTLAADSSSASYLKNLSHFATSQASAVHKVLPAPLDTDLRNDDNITKVITLNSLKLATSKPVTVTTNSYAPDVTAYSLGVLADVKNGGLRKDLTAAFEDDGSSNAGQYNALKGTSGTGSGMDAQCLYRSTATFGAVPDNPVAPFSGSATMDGLRWRSLYLYYNLYKNTMPLNRSDGGKQAAPTGIQSSNLAFSGGAHSIPQRAPNSTEDGMCGAHLMDPMVPVTLQARVDVAMESFVDPTTGNYRLRLRYYPMMVLWNPYSVRLTSSLAPSQSFYTNLFRRWSINIKAAGVGVPPFDNVAYNLFQGSGYLPTLNTKAADTTTFEPGEIKFFTLPDKDIAKTTLGEPGATNVCVFNDLANTGALADWCQYYDIPWAGTHTDDVVDVTVSNTSLDANATYNNNGPLNAWPDGTKAYSGRISTYSPPTTKATSAWPNPKPQMSTLNGTPFLIVGFSYRAKGIKQTPDANYFNAAFNPPMFMGNSTSLTNLNTVGYWREMYARNFKPYTAVSEVQNLNGHTSWGNNSVGVDPVSTQNSQLVLIDVPIQPMFSLGQFAHLSPFYYASSGGYQAEYFASNFIGGSLASPNVAMNQNTNNTGSTLYMDHSFMANQALFDSYFLSTVPASGQRAEDTAKYVMKSSELADAITRDAPLPNNRMRFYRKNGAPPTPDNLRDVRKAAANLLLDGAFNINSTSVNAWRALLSSLSGNDLKLWNPSAGSSQVLGSATLKNPIPRFWSTTNQGAVNKAWEGMRALSDDEVTELAKQIVRQVKTRGPFLSLADFLNRRLAPAPSDKSQLYTMGALQAAIENTSPDINAPIKAVGTASSLSSTLNGDPFGANVYNNPASAGPGSAPWGTILTSSNTSIPANTATGIPGYLMQQDLVQAFAPVMTPRSDTFVIRGYGESRNAQNVVQARAWCEAVVQRQPAYVDQSDPALSATTSQGSKLGDATPPYSPTTGTPIVNPINQTFGRKFEIASFRWLNENEL